MAWYGCQEEDPVTATEQTLAPEQIARELEQIKATETFEEIYKITPHITFYTERTGLDYKQLEAYTDNGTEHLEHRAVMEERGLNAGIVAAKVFYLKNLCGNLVDQFPLLQTSRGLQSALADAVRKESGAYLKKLKKESELSAGSRSSMATAPTGWYVVPCETTVYFCPDPDICIMQLSSGDFLCWPSTITPLPQIIVTASSGTSDDDFLDFFLDGPHPTIRVYPVENSVPPYSGYYIGGGGTVGSQLTPAHLATVVTSALTQLLNNIPNTLNMKLYVEQQMDTDEKVTLNQEMNNHRDSNGAMSQVGIDYLIQYIQLRMDGSSIGFAMEALRALRNGSEVDFEDKVILDKTFVDNEKLQCVYDKLAADNNSLFRNTVGAFIDDPKFNLTFKVGNCSTTDDACTNDNDPNNIVITIENITANPLELAQMILHEAIHAELARYVAQFESGVDVNDKPRLFELYKYYRESGVPERHLDHPYMSIYYVDSIASTLREFDDNSYSLDYYKSIAWDGLRVWDVNRVLDSPMTDTYESYRPIVIENSTVCD